MAVGAACQIIGSPQVTIQVFSRVVFRLIRGTLPCVGWCQVSVIVAAIAAAEHVTEQILVGFTLVHNRSDGASIDGHRGIACHGTLL